MKRFSIFLAAFTLSVLSCGASSATVLYSVVDLGTLGGTSSTANDVNNAGQIVGRSNVAGDGAEHAFLYSGGTMYDLGAMGYANSTATRINGSGQIVGYSYNTAGDAGYSTRQSFLYSGGAMQNIGSLDGSGSYASDINDSGLVVGSIYLSADSPGATNAYVYRSGVMTNIGGATAFGVNNLGQIVGTEGGQGVLYENGTKSYFGPSVGLTLCIRINDAGQVVGYSTFTNESTGYPETHAFLYDGSVMYDLGTPGGNFSYARDINNAGQIVGSANCSAGFCAFLYNNGTMSDLNDLIDSDSGWTLSQARGINDLGQIVGSGVINGETHAFLLTPVPEPSIFALISVCGLGLVAYVQRR